MLFHTGALTLKLLIESTRFFPSPEIPQYTLNVLLFSCARSFQLAKTSFNLYAWAQLSDLK